MSIVWYKNLDYSFAYTVLSNVCCCCRKDEPSLYEQYLALVAIADSLDMDVVNVPADGACLFHAVAAVLDDVTKDIGELRVSLADFMEINPYLGGVEHDWRCVN
jgi:hypothetical protein